MNLGKSILMLCHKVPVWANSCTSSTAYIWDDFIVLKTYVLEYVGRVFDSGFGLQVSIKQKDRKGRKWVVYFKDGLF